MYSRRMLHVLLIPLFGSVSLSLCGCPPVPSGWVSLFGGAESDQAYALQQAADGGFIVAGMTQSDGAGGSDMYLLKLDDNGNLDWSTTYGGPGEDVARGVVQTRDRGYVMAGTTDSFGTGGTDACLVKLDQDGVLSWNQTYGTKNDETIWCLAKTDDGGFIMAGAQNTAQAASNVLLIKADSDGAEEWTRVFDYGGNDDAFGVIQTSDGGYAIAGVSFSLADFWSRMLLVKTDADGIEEWSHQFGEAAAGFSISETTGDGFVMAGITNMWSTDPWEEQDGFLVKTDADGVEEWSRIFDRPGQTCRLTSVQQTSDGGFILGGDIVGDAALLLKLAPNGVEQWSRTYGGGDRVFALSSEAIEAPYYGGFCFAGSQYHYSTTDWSVYVVRTDELGSVTGPLPVP